MATVTTMTTTHRWGAVGGGRWRVGVGGVGGGVKTACQTLTFLAHPEVKALVEVHEVAGQRSSADRQVHRLRLYYLHTASTHRHNRGTGTMLSQARHSHSHNTTLSQAQHFHRHNTLTGTTLSQSQHSQSHNPHSHMQNTVSGKDRQ